MRRSSDRILVTHVGALPAPIDVWGSSDVDDETLRREVRAVVAAQKAAGVDFVNEGEVTKGGNWVMYINSRIDGFEPAEIQGEGARLLFSSADWVEFADFYRDRMAAGTLFEESRQAPKQVTADARIDWDCVRPLEYRGHAAFQREIKALTESLQGTPASDAFLTSTAPLSVEFGRKNRYYATEEEFV